MSLKRLDVTGWWVKWWTRQELLISAGSFQKELAPTKRGFSWLKPSWLNNWIAWSLRVQLWLRHWDLSGPCPPLVSSFSLHICCFGFLSCSHLVLAPKFYSALQMSVQSSLFSVLWGVDVALILSAPDCFVAPVSKAFWPFVSFMAWLTTDSIFLKHL